MIKFREARYCNLKLFLLFLVIYGHLIEPQIQKNHDLMLQYRWIYLVHMPLFAFLSGFFVKGCDSCAAQLKRFIPIYLILQTTAVLFGNGTVKPMTPYWHLWYLLSCSYWLGFAWLWFRFAKGNGKTLILILSLVAGCFSGHISIIGRVHSLSRTVVLFPYFWFGIICDKAWIRKRHYATGAATLLLGIVMMSCFGNRIEVSFLYQADPFGSTENGMILRMLCYLFGILFGFFLLTWMPDKRYCFTKAGADTLPAYLFHAPAAIVLRETNWSCLLYVIVSAASLWLIYQLFRWHSPMYAIIVPERRNQ